MILRSQSFRSRRTCYPSHQLVILCLASLLGAYCGYEPRHQEPPLPVSAATEREASRVSPTRMPASLRAAYLQSRYQGARADYAITPPAALTGQVHSDGIRIGRNAAHGLELRFDASGFHLRGAGPGAGATSDFALTSYGCADAPIPAGPAVPRAAAFQNYVEYHRPGLIEWYRNGPLGVEQGFTVERESGCARGGTLALSLSVGGDFRVRQRGTGADTFLELHDPGSGRSLYYGELFAHDAEGRELPARMSLGADQIVRIEIDAAAARYPLTIDPTWGELEALFSPDLLRENDFGSAVAVSGDIAIVGAPGASAGSTTRAGAAYVFVRSAFRWKLEQELYASDQQAGDRFGSDVALFGNTALIGSPEADVAGMANAGAAYVFVRSGSAWTQEQKITAPSPAANKRFSRVALHADTAALSGNSGATDGTVSVFVRSGTTWGLQQTLAASDRGAFSGSVALFEDTLIVGAPSADLGGKIDAGAAYVFVRSGTTWTEQQKLTASDAAARDQFGLDVALSRDSAIVGAYLADLPNKADAGAAYVFVRSGTTWTEQQKLTASDGAAGDKFGLRVALYEDTALVGAPSASDARQMFAGAAYLYVRSGTTWTEQQRLRSRFSYDGRSFGKAIALSADTGIVGKSSADNGGAALVFVPQAPNGTPCDWPTSCQSGYCIDGVCCNSACGNGTKGDCLACLKSETGLATDGLCGPIVAAAAVVCRPSAGSCDIPEICDGVSATCPEDSFAAKDTQCAVPELRNISGRCGGTTALCLLVSRWVDPYPHQIGCSYSRAPVRCSTPSGFFLSLVAVALLLRRRRPIATSHAPSDETSASASTRSDELRPPHLREGRN